MIMPIQWFFIISSLLVLFFPTLELKSHRFLHRSSFIHVLYLSVQYYFRWLGSIYLVLTKRLLDFSWHLSYLATHYRQFPCQCALNIKLVLQIYLVSPASLHLASAKLSISIYSLSMVCSFPVLYMDCPFKDLQDSALQLSVNYDYKILFSFPTQDLLPSFGVFVCVKLSSDFCYLGENLETGF